MPATDGWSRRAAIRTIAGTALVTLAGCAAGGGRTTPATPTPTAAGAETPTADASPTALSWRETELADVATGEVFTVGQFVGQPVLLEFFAVWCPVCTEQQREMHGAGAEMDDLILISLNTDPNEDADRVREHLQRNEDFDWRYAVAPSAMTQSLVDEFGSIIANPPAAPIVRVCRDGRASLLDRRGVKPTDELVAAVEQC